MTQVFEEEAKTPEKNNKNICLASLATLMTFQKQSSAADPDFMLCLWFYHLQPERWFELRLYDLVN